MRKIFLFSVLAASFLAASCESEFDPTVLENGNTDVQQPEQPQPEGEYITLSINAGPSEVELKSLFDNGGPAVKWGTGDILSVIDDEGNLHVSKPSETSAKTLEFVFENWPVANKPVYAFHTGAYGENLPTDTYTDGLINTSMESEQPITKAGRFARTPVIAIGDVVESEEGYSVSMSHAYGLVKLTIATDNAYSAVKLEGCGENDALAGDVTLNPVTKELKVVNGVKEVQIVNDNGFAAGDYYICVLPGVLTTPKITLVALDGTEKTLQNGNNVPIAAGVITNFGTPENVTEDESTDLSSTESANCYIINAAGNYKFKAVQGNSTTALEGVASVEVLWSESADLNDVVASVEYKNGYVYFTTPETYQYGNALIAAKDAEDTILWSWHIWATNRNSYPSDVTYPSGLVMMDRNIGARDVEGKYHSLLYQWGRKDPIPGSAGSGSCVSLVFSSTDLWKTYGSEDTDVAVLSGFTFLFAKNRCDLDVAVKNPTTVYGAAGDGSAAFWANGENENDLWGESKTVNDPCPPGYKVPTAFEGGAVASDDVNLSSSRFADLSSATWTYGGSTGKTRTAAATWDSVNTYFACTALVDMYGSTNSKNINKYVVRNPKCADNEGRAYIWTASRITENKNRFASVLYISNAVANGVNASEITMQTFPKNNACAVRCEKIQK